MIVFMILWNSVGLICILKAIAESNGRIVVSDIGIAIVVSFLGPIFFLMYYHDFILWKRKSK